MVLFYQLHKHEYIQANHLLFYLDKVLIVDDLIATAGTASAARNLIKKLGGEIIECAFIVELTDLKGRDKLRGENIYSVVEFEG